MTFGDIFSEINLDSSIIYEVVFFKGYISDWGGGEVGYSWFLLVRTFCATCNFYIDFILYRNH
jgi:hypothetical protein